MHLFALMKILQQVKVTPSVPEIVGQTSLQEELYVHFNAIDLPQNQVYNCPRVFKKCQG